MSELNVFFFVTNLVITVLVGVFLSVMPRLTRKSFLFGVKVPPEETDSLAAKMLKSRYVCLCVVGSVVILAAVIAQFVVAPEWTLLATMYFPLLFVSVQFAAFVPQHKATLRLKRDNSWKVSESLFAETKTSFTRGNLSSMPWGWYVVSLLLIIITTAALLARYPEMPERIATHYGINMQPDAWADKSVGALLLVPIINIFMLVFMWAMGVIVERGKLQIDANNTEVSFAQHKIYRRRMGHANGFLTLMLVVIFAGFDAPKYIDGFHMSFLAVNALWLIPLVAFIWVIVKAGQGGCKIKVNEETVNNNRLWALSYRYAVNDHGDDRYWALGMFYHNPDDPAIVVGDRFGVNFGFNYSRLSVKVGIVVLALATIATYAWFTIWWITVAL